MTLRRFLVQAHLWLGLTIGLVWALQGLTGALLVFHRELDTMTAGAASGPIAPLSTILANAEAHAGRPIDMVSLGNPAGTVLVASTRGHTVRVEAATGRVIDAWQGEGAWRLIYELHEELLLHDGGKTLIGTSGLLLVTAALTGLWLGWPRGRSWTLAFRPSHWRTARQRLYGWHRMAGLLVALALVIVPLAGAAMAFGSSLRPWLARHAGYQLPYRAEGPLPATIVSPDMARAAAQARFPGARFVRLMRPSEKTPAYVIRLLQPGEVRSWSGTTSVTVDPATGRVLAAYDPLGAPFANRLYDAAFSIHNGELGGLFGRVLILLAGLALPTLYVTGLLAWARKRRARRLSATPSLPPSLPETAPPSPA